MSTPVTGTPVSLRSSSVPTSLAASAGAAALAGALAGVVVWASQVWSLPRWDGLDGDFTAGGPGGGAEADDWVSDPDESEDPDDWSLDFEGDIERWRLTE